MFDEDRAAVDDKETPQRTWAALGAINTGVDSVIVHGNQLALFGGPIQTELARQAFNEEVALQIEERLTRSEIKETLSSELRASVGTYHKRSGQTHAAIHATLNRKLGTRSQTHRTEDQLRHRISLVEDLLRALQSNRRSMRA